MDSHTTFIQVPRVSGPSSNKNPETHSNTLVFWVSQTPSRSATEAARVFRKTMLTSLAKKKSHRNPTL